MLATMTAEGPRNPIGERGRHAPLDTSTFKTNMNEFEAMDVLGKLRASFNVTSDPTTGKIERGVVRGKAVMAALSMDPLNRYMLYPDIHIFASGELKGTGKVKTDYPEWQEYSVHVIFPFDDDIRHFVSASRRTLLHTLPSGVDLDQLVNSNTKVREEALFERQRRLIFEIKGIDETIGRRMESESYQGQTVEDLIRIKKLHLVRYFFSSLDLQKENPHLEEKLFYMYKNPQGKMRIQMRSTINKAMKDQLLDVDVKSNLVLSSEEYSTGIDIDKLLLEYKVYLIDPSSTSDDVEIGMGICKLLGITPEEAKIGILKEREPVTEASSNVGDNRDKPPNIEKDNEGIQGSQEQATVVYQREEPPTYMTNKKRRAAKKRYPKKQHRFR